MPVKRKRKLPPVFEAGRGEHWTDYGHNEESRVFVWTLRHGFTTAIGTTSHYDMAVDSTNGYFRSGPAIVGRVDLSIGLATMYCNEAIPSDDISVFLSELKDKWPKICQVRRFMY